MSVVTCSFSSTGSEQRFAVPAGVSSVSVTAVGGQGGAGGTEGAGAGGSGGSGAIVSGTIPVTAAGVLYVEVGGNGAAGGFNGGGGGAGGHPSGGGGGASDVRTGSCGSPCNPPDPSSLASRLLVAGGGGGGGSADAVIAGSGGSAGSIAAVAAGTNGANDPSSSDGGAGGGGGSTSGGIGGSAGTPIDGDPAAAGAGGSAGQGGSGQFPCCATQDPGGGGGGGYFGGGGGGSGAFDDGLIGGGGGGGAGSDSVPAGGSVSTDTTGVPSVTISYSASGARATPSRVTYSSQPESTISAPRTVTVTNTGLGPLVVTGLTFTGSDRHDYLVTSNGCLGPIAAGASCTLGVSFAPQERGASSASLVISSSDPNGPATVRLLGSGGQLPRGPTGATGPRGPAGKIELVVCHKVTKTTTSGGHKHQTTVQKCTTRLVSGPVKFTIDDGDLAASVSRAGVTYATGLAVPTGADRWQVVLTRQVRKLRPGRYTLTLRTRHGRRRIVQRRTITIT